MSKVSNIYSILCVCVLLIQTPNAHSYEGALEADVAARAEYNDNIFLTAGPHDAVTGIIVTPSLSGIIKEENWEAKLRARLRINKYSDHTIDGNDQFFDLTGQYDAQRNIFSLNINHDLDSNLSSTSTDFGIAGRRVERKKQSVTPLYKRLLTERLVLTLSYTYSDVDYLEAEDTAFTSSISETGAASLQYDLTEIDQLSMSFQAVDYRSKNGLQTIQIFESRIGIDHKFSETLSIDFLVGISRQNSTNFSTQEIDFIDGITIILPVVTDFNNRGLVLDAGITQLLESGSIEGRLSRNTTTNSFGGLDQVDRFKINYADKISALWRYTISGRFDDITSVSANTGNIDRDLFFFESRIIYSITEKWVANASYRYIVRKFKSDTSEDRAPHSNRIYVGLTYNFPSLSTF